MKPTSDMIRKAAVLVYSLDADTADQLLDQMPVEMADRVRRAAASLDDISQAEQDAVLGEFVRGTASPPADDDAEGVELSAKLARDFGLGGPTPSLEAGEPPAADADVQPPFRLLRETAADRLSLLLATENPQTIALVATHLPPAQAASVLTGLPADLHADVMRRMADLDEAHPEIVREVERGLAARMSQLAHVDQRRVARVAALADILRHSAPLERQAMLESLRQAEPELAEQLAAAQRAGDLLEVALQEERSAQASAANLEVPPSRYAGLDELDDVALSAALEAVGADMATLALAGGSAALLDRVTRRLPTREAKRFRRALDKLGPTRLSDIDEAQQALLSAANR
ncbi:MAG: FliG C-terminal domain-containing protein, partial [Pirellulales bacterium]